jgi:hypothetical protein
VTTLFLLLTLGGVLMARRYGFVDHAATGKMLLVVVALLALSAFLQKDAYGFQQCQSSISSDLRDSGRCRFLYGL